MFKRQVLIDVFMSINNIFFLSKSIYLHQILKPLILSYFGARLYQQIKSVQNVNHVFQNILRYQLPINPI